MTDDQTVESMRVMPNVRSLLADQGVTFDNNFVVVSALLPVARDVPHRAVRPQPRVSWGNVAPNGGYDKLDQHEHAARLAAARRATRPSTSAST